MDGTAKFYYAFDKFLLEPKSCTMYCGDEVVPIGLTASKILLCLVQNAEEVVSKETLIDAGWEERIVEPNNLVKQIAEIRKVLDDDAQHPHLIKTAHRRGYIFIGTVNRLNEEEAFPIAGRRAVAAPPDASQSENGIVDTDLASIVTAAGVSPRESSSQHSVNTASRSDSSPLPVVRESSDEGRGETDFANGVPAPPAADSSPRAVASRPWWLVTGAAAAVAIAVTLFLVPVRFRGPDEGEKQLWASVKTVAVLVKPSVGEPDDERLNSRLGRTMQHDLASDQRIREHNIDIVQADWPHSEDELAAAKRLNADAAVVVMYRKTPRRIHYTARVINGRNGSELWSSKLLSLGREEAQVETAISRRLVGEIAPKLTGEDDEAHERHVQKDKSDGAYHRGRFQFSLRSPEKIRRAIEEFEKAILLNPENARAHAGRADCYALLGGFGYNEISPEEAYREANASAKKALEADPTLPEAHATAGLVALMYEQNWETAAIALKQAIRLKTDSKEEYPTARHWYANLLTTQGRFLEAMLQIDRALEADAASRIISATRGWILYFSGDYDGAIEKCNEALNLDSNFYPAHAFLGFAYLQKENYAKAIAELNLAKELSDDSPVAIAYLGYAHGMAGNTAQALKALVALQTAKSRRYVSPYCFAILHVALGQKDRAFERLEELYEEHSPWLINLGIEPMLDPLRDDPRFENLASRVGIKPELLAQSRARAAKASRDWLDIPFVSVVR